ncbi:hypothetical protein CYMTET_32211 [Cymbomonas tetramitiformis]|uniref:Chromo domain-containing protein n=1 Tax=Cymbomonas tetramitiformis TaxID=36881 RepID=A0AAE0KSF6_9CHLO|nr:hypothetical protein CYMTET_32211 [Cymbomonas tetramitiformis]
MVRGKEVEEWEVRWTGYSEAHDQWRTRDKRERGAPLPQLRDFEAARLHMESQVRDEAVRRREQRGRRTAQAGQLFAQLISNPCDEMELLEASECDSEYPLPWEHRATLEGRTLALVTELSANALKLFQHPEFNGNQRLKTEDPPLIRSVKDRAEPEVSVGSVTGGKPFWDFQ